MTIKKAVILAGGNGSRMEPITKVFAKEMLPVVDRPVLDFLINDLIEAGVTDILIVSNQEKTCIQKYFKSCNVNLYFAFQKQALGVDDALSYAKTFVGCDNFFLFYGDVLCFDKISSAKQMQKLFNKTHLPIMLARQVQKSQAKLYGILECQTEKGCMFVTNITEKPKKVTNQKCLANVGQYVLSPQIFDCLNDIKKCQLFTDALVQMAKEKKLLALEFKGRCFDIGNKAGFVLANLYFSQKHQQTKTEIRAFLRDLDKKFK